MQLETIDAPQSATGTDAATNLKDRTTTLHNIITMNYGDLVAIAYDAYPQMVFCTPGAIIGTLYGNIERYGGPTESTAFMRWASRFVTKEAQRHRITAEILAEHQTLIYAAIHEALNSSQARDYSISPEDVYWEVVMLILARAHSLARRGTAKLSTRLYALVKKHVWLMHTSYWNRRHRINRELAERGEWYPVERLSDAEIAAMKPKDDPISDLGYGECKLSLD
jgi:hypothetical protein